MFTSAVAENAPCSRAKNAPSHQPLWLIALKIS
jgi:hypothetical protein